MHRSTRTPSLPASSLRASSLRASSWPLLVAAATLWAPDALGQEPTDSNEAAQQPRQTVLVLDFTSQLGADPELAQLLASMVTTHLHESGRYQLISHQDVETMLETAEERQLLGCASTSCVGEFGSALGAQFLIDGDLSLLGEKPVLTLKLLDTQEAKLVNQISQSLPPRREEFDVIARRVAYDLVGIYLDEPTPWYREPWILGAAAVGVLAAGAITWILLSGGNDVSTTDGTLGTVTLDE